MRELVHGVLALLGTLSCQAAHAEPPSLAGPSLGGTVLDRVPIQARLEATNWWMAGEGPGGPPGMPPCAAAWPPASPDRGTL